MCSGLMQNLEQTQKVLALFQQRVLSTPPDPSESERVIPSTTELDIAAILAHTLRQDQSAPPSHPAQLGNTCQSTGSKPDFPVGNDDGPECCGGFIDCEGLTE